MKTLNLVNVEISSIKYTISKFPDGQQNIVIGSLEKELVCIDYHPVGGGSKNGWRYPAVEIKSRLNNWLDLELIVCAVASLREMGVKEIHLYIPYFMGARSDDNFQVGSNYYIRDVLAPVINSLNFETVTAMDIHSPVVPNCIKRFKKISNSRLVVDSLCKIYDKEGVHSKEFILVSPDAGASKKIFKIAEQIGYEGDIITCSKSRDEHGNLTRVTVPYEFSSKDIIIIDDICDGGATFINIAKVLKSRTHISIDPRRIYLIVTHGIFSAGFSELAKYFDGIYCTNSYGDALAKRDGDVMYEKLVKQLNVF